jgi:hypothetical protein
MADLRQSSLASRLRAGEEEGVKRFCQKRRLPGVGYA